MSKRPERVWMCNTYVYATSDADPYMDAQDDRIAELEAENRRLSGRDGAATIELCFDDGLNPFARRYLKVLDFGVADNVYVVEDAALEDTHE